MPNPLDRSGMAKLDYLLYAHIPQTPETKATPVCEPVSDTVAQCLMTQSHNSICAEAIMGMILVPKQ